MRIFSFMVIFCSALLFTSCGRVETLFDINTRVDMIILAGSNPFEIWGYKVEATFPYELTLDSKGLVNEEIDRVIATEAFFRPKFNAEDLDFIQVVEISVLDPNDPSRSREVFYLDPVPLGPKNLLELRASLPDIKSFIYDDKLFFQVELTYRQFPPTNVEIRIDMEFGAVESE